jgi:hypothetical protein
MDCLCADGCRVLVPVPMLVYKELRGGAFKVFAVLLCAGTAGTGRCLCAEQYCLALRELVVTLQNDAPCLNASGQPFLKAPRWYLGGSSISSPRPYMWGCCLP